MLHGLVDTDIAAIEAELQALQTAPTPPEKKQKPKRTALPAEFPRTLIHHEPDNTHCPCGCALKRIGEDISEKLDYTPGVFTVERHVRGKWVCDDCETLIQAPIPAQVIDKGIPTAGLLAHVMIAKFADHLPAYCLAEPAPGVFQRLHDPRAHCHQEFRPGVGDDRRWPGLLLGLARDVHVFVHLQPWANGCGFCQCDHDAGGDPGHPRAVSVLRAEEQAP